MRWELLWCSFLLGHYLGVPWIVSSVRKAATVAAFCNQRRRRIPGNRCLDTFQCLRTTTSGRFLGPKTRRRRRRRTFWHVERREEGLPRCFCDSSTKSVATLDFQPPAAEEDWLLEDWSSAAMNASTARLHHNAILQSVEALLQPECSMEDRPFEDDAAILSRVDAEHDEDCAAAARDDAVLAMEPSGNNPRTTPSCEWVLLPESPSLNSFAGIVQSLEPLLPMTVIQGLREAAEVVWSTGHRSSRYTYQSSSNYEVHVADLLAQNASLRTQFNAALVQNIYPLLRHTLLPKENETAPLFVYDALVIRYNASAGAAGQPLHRDFGLATVNILLNDGAEFSGGGTWFEQQWSSSSSPHQKEPLHPAGGVGYGLAHRAAERHAGAGLRSGIREILVLFVASRAAFSLRSARLKPCRGHCAARHKENARAAVLCRIRHLALAMRWEPRDGEAVQYLGTALMNLAAMDDDPQQPLLPLAVRCFALASLYTPYDHRVYNNWALALGRWRDQRSCLEREKVWEARIDCCYERALALLQPPSRVILGTDDDASGVRLNYALELSNRDAWDGAVRVLEPILLVAEADPAKESVVHAHAQQLYQFCQSQRVVPPPIHESR